MKSEEPQMGGRVAIVTGAASGIGRAIAEAFAQEGIQVVVADLNIEHGQCAADATGGHFVMVDLAVKDDCRRLVDESLAYYGSVDILVNNAGMQHVDSIEMFPVDIWDKMLAVMLTAPFLLTKYVWQTMKASGWGRIVNVASIHSRVASPYKSAYVAAKHGLIGLTRTAALEGGAHGITANAICPAYVDTAIVKDQIANQARTRGLPPQDVIEQVMLEPAAIKRLISPDEVASLAVYLCSDAAGAVTGADWTIDLGWTAH